MTREKSVQELLFESTQSSVGDALFFYGKNEMFYWMCLLRYPFYLAILYSLAISAIHDAYVLSNFSLRVGNHLKMKLKDLQHDIADCSTAIKMPIRIS